jgi:superfamily II DNA or RNA helicase
MDLVVVIDSRIWLPSNINKNIKRQIKSFFTYKNPDYYKKYSLGFSTFGIDSRIKTYKYVRDSVFGQRLTLPRGGIAKLVRFCKKNSINIKFIDKRTTSQVSFDSFRVSSKNPELLLRPYQCESVEAAIRRQQGIIRAPTGSGKTTAALNLIYRLNQRAMVIMRDRNLLKQWLNDIMECLGLCKTDISYIMGGRKYFKGRPLTLALQQSINTNINNYKNLFYSDPFGIVIVDEAQDIGARTYLNTIDYIPSKYRIGFSADETRRDGKEFLIYDLMGDVIHDTTRTTLEDIGIIHDVTIRVVETSFGANWYLSSEPVKKNFNRLIDEIVGDQARNNVIVNVVRSMMSNGETPALIFTHRREHARDLSTYYLNPIGIKSGILIGGAGRDAERFKIDKDNLLNNRIDIGVGTFKSIGQGHNIPVLRSGICGTPVSYNNPQFFGQLRGRFCRKSTDTGKSDAFFYYIWDRKVFPNYLSFLKKHNKKVEIYKDGNWVEV